MPDDLDECHHGLPPEACSLCLHPPRRPESDQIEYTFSAKFDGQCPICDLPIYIGQTVSRLMPSTRVVHFEGCAP